MELRINNFPIDFSIEHEKTLQEVVESIKNWTQERDLIFLQIEIDKKIYPIDEVPEVEISTIERINCIVQSKSDVVFATIDEGIAYSGRAIDFIDSCLEQKTINMDELANLGQGIDWLVEVFDKIMQLLELDINDLRYKDKTFKIYVEELAGIKAAMLHIDHNEQLGVLLKSKETFLGLSDIFRMVLLSEEMRKLIIKSIDSPDVLILSLQEIKEELEKQLQNIEQVAIAFQTGKDTQGSEGLQTVIDFIYRYTRTCYQVAPVFGVDLSVIEVNGKSLEIKNRDMQDLLRQTMEIMENNDIISLSDILEYELKPLFEDMDQYIDQLVEAISSK